MVMSSCKVFIKRRGKLVLVLVACLWPPTLSCRVLSVCPTYWFPLLHFVHSSRYLQAGCLLPSRLGLILIKTELVDFDGLPIPFNLALTRLGLGLGLWIGLG